jgi:tetratricopeptide (TPR) repeat protein
MSNELANDTAKRLWGIIFPRSAAGRCASALLSLTLAGFAIAEDTVIIAAGQNAGAQTRRTGEIVDFTGETLTLRTATGAEAAIPADRVLEVQTDWTAPHVRGDELFAENKFAEALDQYRAAAREESRAWVRRRLMAQAVWCYRYLGQPEYAAGTFLTLVADDPKTQHFDAIPLAWTPAQPGASFAGRLPAWLESDNDAAALIAASWLLATREQSSAAEKLRELALAGDARIALLAEAQRWRIGAAATEAEIARRLSIVERMPEPLRAGPYFLIGQAQARLKQAPGAALTLLRVPVLYPQHRELAAESLLAAARHLEQNDRREEALRVYRELITEYSESRLTDLAKQGVERLSE